MSMMCALQWQEYTDSREQFILAKGKCRKKEKAARVQGMGIHEEQV